MVPNQGAVGVASWCISMKFWPIYLGAAKHWNNPLRELRDKKRLVNTVLALMKRMNGCLFQGNLNDWSSDRTDFLISDRQFNADFKWQNVDEIEWHILANAHIFLVHKIWWSWLQVSPDWDSELGLVLVLLIYTVTFLRWFEIINRLLIISQGSQTDI